MNEREAWKVERGVWRVAWWALSPEEAGRRGQTGNERGGGGGGGGGGGVGGGGGGGGGPGGKGGGGGEEGDGQGEGQWDEPKRGKDK